MGGKGSGRYPKWPVDMPWTWRQQIAALVRSVNFETNSSLFRALSGRAVFYALGFQTQLEFGGCAYSAGPGGQNVAVIGGEGPIGRLDETRLNGHAWLTFITETGRDLIDFSSGDWQPPSTPCAIAPPAFVWAKRKTLFRAPVEDYAELPLGKPYYTGFCLNHYDRMLDAYPTWVAAIETAAQPILHHLRKQAIWLALPPLD